MINALLEMMRSLWMNMQQGQLPELGHWTYFVLALLVIIQGPLMTLLGAAAAAAGLLKLPLVFLAGILGNLSADILWYYVGRAGKIAWFLRFTSPVRRPQVEERIKVMQQSMNKHSVKLLLLAKLSTGFVVPTLIAVGLARIPWKRWFPVAFLGETIWTGSLALIGYFASSYVARFSQNVRLFGLVMTIVLMCVSVWLVHRYFKRNGFSS
ncbi:MAG: hypothetical protein Fur0021_37200 [Candidatus Promineifilaceae bacterium]